MMKEVIFFACGLCGEALGWGIFIGRPYSLCIECMTLKKDHHLLYLQ
jgi:hypothetical protein